MPHAFRNMNSRFLPKLPMPMLSSLLSFSPIGSGISSSSSRSWAKFARSNVSTLSLTPVSLSEARLTCLSFVGSRPLALIVRLWSGGMPPAATRKRGHGRMKSWTSIASHGGLLGTMRCSGKGKKVHQTQTKQMGRLDWYSFEPKDWKSKTTLFLARAVPVLSQTLYRTHYSHSPNLLTASLGISATQTQRGETCCVLMDAGGSWQHFALMMPFRLLLSSRSRPAMAVLGNLHR